MARSASNTCQMIPSLTADDIRALASWPLVIDAIRAGHRRAKAQVGDSFVGGSGNTMLVRSAWIDGVAAGVKAATVVPANPDRSPSLPAIHAQVMLFDPETGELSALVDGTELTAWKTAGDSALGCDLLARGDAKTLLMVGAGAMADPLIRAHLSVRPNLQNILLWNRSSQRRDALAARLRDIAPGVETVDNLQQACGRADIICCATMSTEPVISGAWVKPGTHVDLVGAYKADMREADDALHDVGRWFVDSRDTTLHHIGELKIPLQSGLIEESSICGDLYDLVCDNAGRSGGQDITVFKNGGGAHLDVMVAKALVDRYAEHTSGT